MARETEELAETLMLLQRQVHALEIVTLRALVELDEVRPGLLDAVSGPVIFQDRPDAQFDEHLGEVDEQISRLLIWARQYRGELK
jgi:hypothetical protein